MIEETIPNRTKTKPKKEKQELQNVISPLGDSYYFFVLTFLTTSIPWVDALF